jgi:hypothetical protein
MSYQMPQKFEREDRYLVIKRKDFAATLTKTETEILDALLWKIEKYRLNRGKPALKCVVVEADWPEYEQTWAAIEARMATKD